MATNQVPANTPKGYRWECVKDGPPDPITGKRNQIKRRRDTKREAEAAVDEEIARRKKIYIKKADSMTFRDVALEWYEVYKRKGLTLGTLKSRRTQLGIIYEKIGSALIKNITHDIYQKMLNDLDDEDYARGTVSNIHSLAKQIFEFALRRKICLENPTDGVVVPSKTLTLAEIEANDVENKYLQRSEINEILEAALTKGLEGDKEMVYLCVFTGMRPGECLALQEPDLIILTREVSINKNIYHEKNNYRDYVLNSTKTNAGRRKFGLDEVIVSMMADYIQKWKEHDALYPPEHDKGFIFRHPNGYPFITQHLLYRVQRLVKFTSIKKYITPYIFRHTYISMLSEAGVDLPTIMQRVGHKDSSTTLQIYTHVTKIMQAKANDKLRVAFKDILEHPEINKP